MASLLSSLTLAHKLSPQAVVHPKQKPHTLRLFLNTEKKVPSSSMSLLKSMLSLEPTPSHLSYSSDAVDLWVHRALLLPASSPGSVLWCTYTPKSALASSDGKRTEFSILREVRRDISRTTTSDFQRANSGPFRRQVETEYFFFLMQRHFFLWSSQNQLHYWPKEHKGIYQHRESTRERKVDKGK